MMLRSRRPSRRGLTSLELLIAMSITIMIGAAIAGMMSVATYGATSQSDNRRVMVRASIARSRLSAYIAPAQAILDDDTTPTELIIWFQDFRAGGTVHASEIRWILFDAGTGTLDVHYVDFPGTWTAVDRDLADGEYNDLAAVNLMAVRQTYEDNGWLSTITLVDGLNNVAISADAAGQVLFDLDFTTSNGTARANVSATIRAVNPPL